MKVKKLVAREINDTRGDKTIEIFLSTGNGEFVASAPNGKSKGSNEKIVWKKSLKEDIKSVNEYFIEEINLNKFDDLNLIEENFSDRVGGNTIIALEYAFLKALAKEKDLEVWELINPRANKFPLQVGNILGGGKHTKGKCPDFQEFHIIPSTKSFSKSVEISKRAHGNCKEILKNIDKKFSEKMNDENAWQSSLSNEQAMDLMEDIRDNMKDEFKEKIHLGIDVAASSFYETFGRNYSYKNERERLTKKENVEYMKKISEKFYYLEDPFEEEDFDSHARLNNFSRGLVCGDDLIVTNYDRLLFALKRKAVNCIIVKPNQIGSLIEVKKIVGLCRKNNIKMVFSHRSGETKENILADLAFGFGADFIKTGVIGKGREEKLNRLIEIEESLAAK